MRDRPLESVADFLAAGLRLPPPDTTRFPPATVPEGFCALTGVAIAEGYAVQDIIPNTTGEWLDLLHGQPHGHLSIAAASCIRGDWNLGNRAIFERPDGALDAFYPLLGRPKEALSVAGADAPEDASDSRAPDAGETKTLSSKALKNVERDRLPRPVWSDLIREMAGERVGQRCVLILATDPKKRVWNRAELGSVGERTPFLLFDSSRHVLRVVHAPIASLAALLEYVEAIYTAGFTKRAIEHSLTVDTKAISVVGAVTALAWERQLAERRRLDYFPLAVIAAQKHASHSGTNGAAGIAASRTIAKTFANTVGKAADRRPSTSISVSSKANVQKGE